jgi:DNA-binding NarL/FixJ family response regulator
MRIRVAVWDPLPVYRRGLVATLSDVGLQVDGPEEPEDIVAWSAGRERRAALITVDATSGQGLHVIARLRELPSRPVVLALLTDSTVEGYIRAMVTGASSAAPRNASPELLRQVFLEALGDRCLLPIEVVKALLFEIRPAEAEERLTDQHLEWLTKLSQGASIADLADTIGYSERAMYRLLRDLYVRMGVSNRTEALMKASRHGWL